MIKEEWKEKYDENLLLEVEIVTFWAAFHSLSASDNGEIAGRKDLIFTLSKSILFKLKYAHYHLVQASRFSKLALAEIHRIPTFKRQHNEFITNCNFDAMINALNSTLDILAKLILTVYNEIYSNVEFKDLYFSSFFKNKSSLINFLNEIDPATAKIIIDLNNMPEKEWVHDYCNQSKHEKTHFSAGAYLFFDLKKEETLQGYNLMNNFRNDDTDKELNDYAPKLFSTHLEKLCELAKSITQFKQVYYMEINEDLIKQLDRTSMKYY